MHCYPFHTPAEVGSLGLVRGGADFIAHWDLRWEGTPHLSSVPHIAGELGDCANVEVLTCPLVSVG